MLSNTGIAQQCVVSLLLLFSLYDGANGQGFKVDLNSPKSIVEASKVLAKKLISYYKGDQPGEILGILPGPPDSGRGPYYWWQAGAMWQTYVDYWHYTRDDTYVKQTTDAILFQADPPKNAFMPVNWTSSLGNDDQAFWGMAAMLAAEVKFPDPPADKPGWLELAMATFNTQAAPDRHDELCNGGLHWQISQYNIGYDYKNTIANGCFFNLGARLARYTGNQSYADWAEKTWDWLIGVQYIDEDWNVYDGGYGQRDNCTVVTKSQFSANVAVLIHGAAMMYSHTKEEKWKKAVDGLLDRCIEFFFPKGIMIERPCELEDEMKCNVDQHSFKGYMHRALATVAQLAPHTHDKIYKVLKTSTEAAVKSCLPDGTCGFRWTLGKYDGDVDRGPAGQAMSALAAVMTMLIDVDPSKIGAPVTADTGGTSKGNPDAGSLPGPFDPPPPLTGKDRAGAGVITTVILGTLIGALVWMGLDLWEGEK
ncbi:glycosyl hydrolase family 76-domain-containing protein [Rhypophila decipiens]|uniref:Mannan endo-1,6-alpha-mannosidase n=1 Tax=Rhypophila decipiens TaxID=261697 RepID=A0AAN6Y878_9PEZI|nr:glycosyl hydrolase family 76-domain-containing protein [Rhypophila decipiens]